ncbi:hypothetical protein [Ferrimonas balearica]|uniref:hypothetical protein n=1 Tax=Ferrimonas balearica TaxID=44012 RepID=UPI001C95973B|nr:hypothetical protein [Ferrimonas balearica]MBY5980323.1 hypothetical protein [Ferrimonas balearica]
MDRSDRVHTRSGVGDQATHHKGARPFNKEELDNIRRVGSCLACHGSDEMPNDGQAPNDATHNAVLRKMLEE